MSAEPGNPKRPWYTGVDGPTGSGKSTLADKLARAWSSKGSEALVIDSGYTFRAAALALSRDPVLSPYDFRDGLEHLPAHYNNADALAPLDIRWRGESVTSDLRNSELDEHIPTVASSNRWRAVILGMHRKLIHTYGDAHIVVVGRDTNTTLVPRPRTAVYLLADEDVRQERRRMQFEGATGLSIAVGPPTQRDEDVKRELLARSGTIYIDSTTMTRDEVAARVHAQAGAS